MKMLKYALVAAMALASVACSKWTDDERLTFDNQKDLKRAIPFIELTSADQLTAEQQKYYSELRAWKQTPHVRGFGWFGGWTAKGTDPQKYLRMLPDSVDIVSLWGTHGSLTEAQKTDLKLFREVKGGKVLLCWIVQNLGDQLTPQGKNATDYWVTEKGGGNFLEGVKAYANAICDTIEKYDLDGFDLDYEPGYGHSGNMATTTAWISETENVNMYTFIKTLYDRLNPKGRIVVMDGEPYYMDRATSKMVSYYIYQAYDEATTARALQKLENGGTFGYEEVDYLDNWEGKSFLTLEFQKYSKTGGFPRYTSSNPEIQKLDVGRQIMDYATMLMPNGKRIAGIGTYHMELDTEGGSYRFLRQALNAGNRVSDTQKADFQ
ncbi:MAG: endoglycosidase [Porphyromonadaceae bacterium]|nr:endoglycosidase [Porphyromonadaceae bacterium]